MDHKNKMKLLTKVLFVFIIVIQQIYIQVLLFYSSTRKSNKYTNNEISTEGSVAKNENRLKPVSCTNVFQRLHDAAPTLTSASDINKGFLFGRLSNTSNPFWLSFHDPEIDHVRGTTYGRGVYYEYGVTDIYNIILRGKKPGIVIDVGMNIGWYSFLSASLGHQVFAFEPIPHNHIRYCQSLYLNHWDNRNITCYPNGLGDTHGVVLYIQWLKNYIGGATWSEDNKSCRPGGCTSVMLTTLDTVARDLDWFDITKPPLIYLLKIDVEGSEPSVIRGATRLISTKTILNILMEYRPDTELIKMTDFIINCGYELKRIGNWAGSGIFDVDVINQLNVNEQSLKIYDTCKAKKTCQNLWWSLKA